MIDLVIEPYDALPCELAEFKINGIPADKNDFGFSQDDGDREDVEPYCCSCNKFTSVESNPDVLKKYGITEEEYGEICDRLEEELYVGACGWCS